MAKTEIGASVNVEFSSIGDMRKAIKEATSELVIMQDQFGKTSPQAIAAAKRIAELKDRIQDATEQANLFDPGKRFSAFTNAASQVAAGFSAVQGAMALVGIESEDLQKQLVKVQGAIALSQGLSQLKDLGKAYDEVKIVAVDAFKSIRAAIGLTGIGLLVIALGAIVVYWDKIKGAVSGVSAEQKKLNEETEKNVKAQQKKLDALAGQENILKLQGKSEKEILNLKIKATDEVINATRAQINQNVITLKAQIEASKRNKEILQGILAFISVPIAALLKGVDLIGKAVGKNFDLYNKFYGGISSFVFDPEKERVEGQKVLDEQAKAFDQLKSQRAGFQLQIDNIDKEEAKKKAENQAKINEENQKKEDAANKVLDDARRAKLTEQQREEEDVLRAFEERKKTLQLAGKNDFATIEEQREIELAAIRKKYADEEEAKRKEAEQKKIEAEKKESERLKAAHENTRKMVAEQNAALLQAEINLQNQRFNAAQAGLQLLESLAGENERIANLIFAVQKGLEIARIVTDTARGIVAAKAGLAAVPPFIGVLPNPAFVLAAAAAAKQIVGLKIAAGVGIAQIAGASIQKFKKGGGAGATGGIDIAGGGGAPVTAQPSPTVTAQALNAQAINDLGNQGMRAYILNSDITNNEQRNAYLQRNARLG